MAEKINLKFFYDMATDKEIINWLMTKGLIADKYLCCKCGRGMKLIEAKKKNDKYIWRCRRNNENESNHDIVRSVRNGSWFSDSRMSMRTILCFTYMWCMKTNNKFMMRELGVSNRTVADWNIFCRDVCVELCVRENNKLGGEGKIVEIDECKFGTRKSDKGKINGQWVFGGIERGSEKSFMVVVEERNKSVLLDLIKKYILPGSTIISHCWKCYSTLEDEDYKRMTVDHSIHFKNPDAEANTQSIEGTWSAIKKGLGASKINSDHFDSYLFEYMWRRRNRNHDLVERFFDGIKEIYTPLGHDREDEVDED